ncbi:hypothetical protein COV86_00005, partial [Candidatus Roizmanbacteria bacterium CG11_big_fil_rev_8_21_14_0_20_35_14]
MTYNPVNDAPVANDVSISTNEDTAVEIALSGSDVDGDILTYSIVTSPSHGTLGEISGNKVSYTPTANYNGSDSFTFKANDGTVDSNATTVSITVIPPPVISNQLTSNPSETSITITWTTDNPSTSRVVYDTYDTVSHSVLGAAPNYDYANSTVEDSTKVTSHSVGLTGLTAGTTYYYRTVSHGSPESVGEEQTFKTTSVTTTTSTDGGGGETAVAQPSVCNDQKPGSAPLLLSAVSNGVNSITLNWAKANDPTSYYLVTFGTKPGEQLYGNPNV